MMNDIRPMCLRSIIEISDCEIISQVSADWPEEAAGLDRAKTSSGLRLVGDTAVHFFVDCEVDGCSAKCKVVEHGNWATFWSAQRDVSRNALPPDPLSVDTCFALNRSIG